MTKRLVVVGMVSAAFCLTCPRPVRAAGVTKEQLNGLVKKLEANAALWVKDEDVDKSVEQEVGRLSFDKDSAVFLNEILRSSKRDTAYLYAASRLLGRLRGAKPEVVQAALTGIKAVHARAKATYRKPPQISRSQSAAMKLPTNVRGMSTDVIMSRMASLQKLCGEKTAREAPLVKHNEVVGDIERSAYRLMVEADEPREDASLIKTMFLEERKGSFAFLVIADQYANAARKMSPERAARLCSLLRPQLARISMQAKKPYYDPSKILVKTAESSSYDKKDEYAGIKVLHLYNALVKAAKNSQLKPVPVPDGKKIDEFNKNRR